MGVYVYAYIHIHTYMLIHTALIVRKLQSSGLNLVALGETRRPRELQLREEQERYTFCFTGKNEEFRRRICHSEPPSRIAVGSKPLNH